MFVGHPGAALALKRADRRVGPAGAAALPVVLFILASAGVGARSIGGAAIPACETAADAARRRRAPPPECA